MDIMVISLFGSLKSQGSGFSWYLWTSSGRNDLLFLNPTLKSNFSRHQLGISLGSKTLTSESPLGNSLGFTF